MAACFEGRISDLCLSFEFVRNGKLYLDRGMGVREFTVDEVFNLEIHVANSHRVQWNIYMRLLDDYKDLFPNINTRQDFQRFYRSFAMSEVNEKYL